MKLFDHTFPSPAENLAADEALLDWCEENDGGEILRFWESPKTFVVVGYANKVATEVNVANCESKNIPILRRCSGGGAVLQGYGCLNYALLLRMTESSPFAGISSANQFIMERNRAAIQSLVQGPKFKVEILGHTDLAINYQLLTINKFSGNSQRRRKNYLLFHGTFLLNFNLALVGEFLHLPSKQPDYRGNRSHAEFLMNLNLSAGEVKSLMQQFWKANSLLQNPPLEEISKLAREKYSTREWNYKF